MMNRAGEFRIKMAEKKPAGERAFSGVSFLKSTREPTKNLPKCATSSAQQMLRLNLHYGLG
ncbi:hypothetical protein AMR76_14045 [Vibrio furnissii]|uniref:Uncharacterized protein n=1 Tax=Vibrio furnissii TaxID=29494 RepID=A0A0Q2MC25_VIBFU|nr:hypothetical protein AMR76_14045 [Vibrio furnissii]